MTVRWVRVRCITILQARMLVTCCDDQVGESYQFTADRAHFDTMAALMRSRDLFAIRDLTPEPAP